MIAPAMAALMWKLMTNPGFGILSYFVGAPGLSGLQLGERVRPRRSSPSC